MISVMFRNSLSGAWGVAFGGGGIGQTGLHAPSDTTLKETPFVILDNPRLTAINNSSIFGKIIPSPNVRSFL